METKCIIAIIIFNYSCRRIHAHDPLQDNITQNQIFQAYAFYLESGGLRDNKGRGEHKGENHDPLHF